MERLEELFPYYKYHSFTLQFYVCLQFYARSKRAITVKNRTNFGPKDQFRTNSATGHSNSPESYLHVGTVPFRSQKKDSWDLHHKSLKTDSYMTKYSCSDHHRGIKHQPQGPLNPLQLPNRPQPRYIPLFQRQKQGGTPPRLGGPNQHKCCHCSP